MSYFNKALLVDANKKPIPQYYDPIEDVFKPLTKEVEIANNTLVEQKTQADAVSGKVTFAKKIRAIELYNRDTVDGVFKINGLNVTVPAGETAEFIIGGTPNHEISITGSTKYIISRYE